jgi:hypothetical protein
VTVVDPVEMTTDMHTSLPQIFQNKVYLYTTFYVFGTFGQAERRGTEWFVIDHTCSCKGNVLAFNR